MKQTHPMKLHAMKTSLLAAAFLILLCCPRLLLACSCFGSPSPCGSFGSAEAVFVGTVTRVESELVKFENTNDYVSNQIAHVQVDEAFKSAKAAEFIFRSYGTSCDAVYKEGQRWLFYANYDKKNKSWFTQACGRSTLVENAADDLVYLRGLPGSAQKTRLAGVLKSEP